MTATEYLRQYRTAELAARRYKREYDRELELIDTVRSTADIDGLPRGNGINKRVEDRAVRLADKAMDWKMAQLDALHLRQEIFETIQLVGGDEADVLVARYIELLPWKEVEHYVGWSRPKVWTLHRDGIDKIAEIIK